MGLFDDYFDPAQFQADGGLFGRLLSLRPDLDPSQPNANGANPQNLTDTQVALQASPQPIVSLASASPGLGARLSAGFQSWAQTPAGSPFAALANGITGFNNAANGSFIGPPAPTPAQLPDLSDRLGAAFQSWAHTPVGSPFVGIANGINGFNTGQQVAAATPTQARTPTQASDPDDRQSAGIQSQPNMAPGNMVPSAPVRRFSTKQQPPLY